MSSQRVTEAKLRYQQLGNRAADANFWREFETAQRELVEWRNWARDAGLDAAGPSLTLAQVGCELRALIQRIEALAREAILSAGREACVVATSPLSRTDGSKVCSSPHPLPPEYLAGRA